MPTRAPSTCRSPASPRSCQVSSQTWARACAGTASPKTIRIRAEAAGSAVLDLPLAFYPEEGEVVFLLAPGFTVKEMPWSPGRLS